jgi:hypothetical protein
LISIVYEIATKKLTEIAVAEQYYMVICWPAIGLWAASDGPAEVIHPPRLAAESNGEAGLSAGRGTRSEDRRGGCPKPASF